MKILLVLSLLVTGCVHGPVKKVVFGPGVDTSKDQLLVCAYLNKKQSLTCFCPETARLMAGERKE